MTKQATNGATQFTTSWQEDQSHGCEGNPKDPTMDYC